MAIAPSGRRPVTARAEHEGLGARHAGRRAVVQNTAARYTLAAMRICLGWILLWAFLDKAFGLGRDTTLSKAWVNGGSPTSGFQEFATKGPFAGMHQDMAGAVWVDWLFMAGLLCIGVALITGVALRITAVAGVTLMLLLWSGVVPPKNNPLVDQHWVYALALILFPLTRAGHVLGLGTTWERLPVVRRYPFLH